MRYLIFTITLIIGVNINAQVEPNYKNIFLRVYNLEGKKIAKGKLLIITEKSLTLLRRGKRTEILLDNIDKIRTRRSYGNNVIAGAAIGGGALAIVGALSAPSDGGFISWNPTEGAMAGTVVGGFFGSGVGAITGIFKKNRTFEINADKAKFEMFKVLVHDLNDEN